MSKDTSIKKGSEKKIYKKQLQGVVSSTKMDKTAVVKIKKTKSHPKYKKLVSVTKSYLVDDPKNQAKEGQKVTIIHAKPTSAKKRWRIKY